MNRIKIRRCITKLALSVTVFSVAMLAASSVAVADAPTGPTQGDAQAAFQAFFTGGLTVFTSNPLANGAPARGAGAPFAPPPEDSARIYPLAEDASYCQGGWHVIMLGNFDDPSFYTSRSELLDYLMSVTMEFLLDGAPLTVETTSVREFSHPLPEVFPDVDTMMVRTYGAFLAPGALSLGTHELRTIVHDPLFGDADWTVSFTAVAC